MLMSYHVSVLRAPCNGEDSPSPSLLSRAYRHPFRAREGSRYTPGDLSQVADDRPVPVRILQFYYAPEDQHFVRQMSGICVLFQLFYAPNPNGGRNTRTLRLNRDGELKRLPLLCLTESSLLGKMR